MNEPEHRFIWYLCDKYKVMPDSDFIEKLDPVQKIWMFHNWVSDQQDKAELAKNQAYLIGSFWNPEAVKQLMGENTHISTEEEFEESSQIVKNTDKFDLDKLLGNNVTSSKKDKVVATTKRKKRIING